jgi:hypothetical protein
MGRHELEASSLVIAAVISVATLIVNADARAVRAAARESIQSLGESSPAQDDIDIDVDQGWNPNWSRPRSPRLQPVTAIATGELAFALPSSCVLAGRFGATYYNCNGVWYEPRFARTSITYVVVNPPPQIASSLALDELAPQTRHER